MRRQEGEWVVELPERPVAGIATFVPMVDGRPASTVQDVAYPHIRQRTVPCANGSQGPDSRCRFASPGARIGYVGGGSDNVGVHMRRLGLDVTDLGEAELNDGFACGLHHHRGRHLRVWPQTRPQGCDRQVHRFVEKGGHLVTLYHRPPMPGIPSGHRLAVSSSVRPRFGGA